MSRLKGKAKPPGWLLLIFCLAVPAWLLGAYWLNNVYSGWSRLAAAFPAGGRQLTGSVGPTTVTVVRASGRRYTYTTKKGYKQVEAGFDEEGFWVRSRGSGWFSGPGTPVFVPWDAVERCRLLRAELRSIPFALVIQDQSLLDACEERTSAPGRP